MSRLSRPSHRLGLPLATPTEATLAALRALLPPYVPADNPLDIGTTGFSTPSIFGTSLAAMLGALPLAVGFGDGAELRQPLGISIIGGLLVSQVLTLQWATWALPVSVVLSLLVRRPVPVLIAAVIGVVIHLVGPVVLPALLGGEPIATIMQEIQGLVPKLNPAVLALDLVAYAFLIFVFSLTRRDMFRSYAPD